MMSLGLRFGQTISAQIAGHHGDYRTQVRLTRKLDGDCSCPSDVWPCKQTLGLFGVAGFDETDGSGDDKGPVD